MLCGRALYDDDANTGRVRGCSVAMTRTAGHNLRGRPHADTAAMERIKTSPNSADVGCPDTVRMHPSARLPSHGLTVFALACRCGMVVRMAKRVIYNPRL